MSMNQQEENSGTAAAWWVVGGAVAAVLAGVLWFTVWGAGSNFGADAAAPAAQKASLRTVYGEESGDYVVAENGLVKFYFAVGSANLSSHAPQALSSVLEGIRAGKTAVVSGFHDATGDAAPNEQLSKQRAFAVRDALVSLGAPAEKILLQKPADTEGSGDNREARRVEVSLQ